MQSAEIARRPIQILPSIAVIVVVAAIAVAGGLATDTGSAWYATLARPSWQPPNWLFGPVWGVIYLLFIISAISAWHNSSSDRRARLMTLYIINGILNLAWTFIFFQGHAPLWAGIEIILLWISILAIMIRVRPVSRVAFLALIPYLLWVTFASVLNWSIVSLN